MGRLTGKRALVTGGASGIGRATSLLMAAEGASVVVADLDEESASRVAGEAVGGAAVGVAWDVSDAAVVEERFSQSEALIGGPIDVLFNNAGIAYGKDAPSTSDEEWQRTIDVNLSGVWYLSREFIRRRLAAGGGGAIVSTASINALYVDADYAAYIAAKGGVASLTRALAFDHGGQGIRVNCVCPGWTLTPMIEESFRRAGDDEGVLRERAAAGHALNRLGQPEEIASAVVFLASEDASFVTGVVMPVDGGMSIGQRTI